MRDIVININHRTWYKPWCKTKLKFLPLKARILGDIISIIDEIGRIEIWLWPRKFKNWGHFELHLEKILEVLLKKY